MVNNSTRGSKVPNSTPNAVQRASRSVLAEPSREALKAPLENLSNTRLILAAKSVVAISERSSAVAVAFFAPIKASLASISATTALWSAGSEGRLSVFALMALTIDAIAPVSASISDWSAGSEGRLLVLATIF